MAIRIGTGWFVSALCLAACAGSPSGEDDVDGVSPDGDVGDDDDDTDVDGDDDGDGLSDSQEADLGSDPALADSDGDGIDDGDEVTGGTDLLQNDTDGDGYGDGDERHANTDPLDASSVIYQGGWPYNREKDALQNLGFQGSLGAIEIGGQFPDLVGLDQHGELVHLYDFANHGKPVVVDFSAQWCVPCMQLSDYLIGGNDGLDFDGLRTALETDQLYWITVMSQNIDFEAPTTQTALEWSQSFPDERIPVLAPPNARASMHYIELLYFPTSVWLDENMIVRDFDNEEPYQALESLEATF